MVDTLEAAWVGTTDTSLNVPVMVDVIKHTCDGGHNTGGGAHGEGSLSRHDRVGDGVGCVGVSATDGGHLYIKRARMIERVGI